MLRYRIVKKMLTDMLLAYPVSARIPSRTELCRQLDTSRATLDKAISELENEGMLRSYKGSGTFINKHPSEACAGDIKPWCVIVPDTEDEMYSDLLEGALEVADRDGIRVIKCSSGESLEKQTRFIEEMKNIGCSGFIIVPVIIDNSFENMLLYRSFMSLGIPIIFCTREVDGIGIPVVKSSDFYGGYIATKHLLEKGYRRIAYIATTRFRTSFERCQGYLSAQEEYGLEIDRKLIYIPNQNNNRLSIRENIEVLLDEAPDVDGIFCFNDKVAREVYDTLRYRNKKISDEIGIIGYVNMPLCEQLVPKLTSVKYETKSVGRMAAEILLKTIRNLPVSNYNHYIFSPKLVIRDSCMGKKRVSRAV